MDLEFKAPKLETFYSPNQRPQSVSPVWSDKEKPEEDADALISDGDDQDQTTVQRIDGENSNGCIENYSDALEWENGIGTLEESDLKFRMNEHGDIEVIMETLPGDDKASDKSTSHKSCTTSLSPEKASVLSEMQGTSDAYAETGNKLPMPGVGTCDLPMLEKLVSENNLNLDMQHVLDDSVTKTDAENALEDQCYSGIVITTPKDIETDSQICDVAEDEMQLTKQSSTNQERDSVLSCINPTILQDNLPEYDPVLSEDMATMLYKSVAEASCPSMNGIEIEKETPSQIPGDCESTKHEMLPIAVDHAGAGPGKCIICGLPSRLANRFCSRQCLGKNAAITRRANQLAVNGKRAKVVKKKCYSRGRLHHYPDHNNAPHPDDVLTVVQDESPGKRSNLKIKIRWSSVSNGYNDEDYSPEPRESSKRKAAAAAVNYAGTRGTRRKRFTWNCYLAEQYAIAAPPDAFEDLTRRDPFPKENPFQIYMALEAVDPEHEALICPMFVAEVQGCRIRLSFCGYPEVHDFWTNTDNPLLFPCGFCEETGRTLELPKGYTEQRFEWGEYAAASRLTPAPKEIFMQNTMQKDFPKLLVGQKLEAVDKHNPELVCVATVHDIIDDRVLIHFDGWSHSFDCWCSATSQHLHPAGWCKIQGKELTTPKGYGDSKKFSWDKYLVETGSMAANLTVLCPSERSHKFENGMKLEVVDPRNKIVIRVATIVEINGFNVKIHFDGWSDMYDFWTHLESEDLHPSGWCERTGHPLQPPIALDELSDSSLQSGGCPIPGCSGIGHIRGAKFQNHYSEFGCPYSPQNLMKEHVKDRLAAYKPRRSASSAQNGDSQTYVDADPDFVRPQLPARAAKVAGKRRIGSSQNSSASYVSEAKRTRSSLEYNREYSHTKNRQKAVRGHSADAVSRWTAEDVAKFVGEITSEPLHGKAFVREEIDGRAMLMLAQSDLLRVLSIKLGPAVKIYNAILNIKKSP